ENAPGRPASFRSSATTCAPSACNFFAIANPRPDAAPVTIATCSLNPFINPCNPRLIRPDQLELIIQLNTPTRLLRQLNNSILRQRLTLEQLSEQRHESISLRTHHQKLRNRTVRERVLQVIREHTRAMRHDGNIVSSRHRNDSSGFS